MSSLKSRFFVSLLAFLILIPPVANAGLKTFHYQMSATPHAHPESFWSYDGLNELCDDFRQPLSIDIWANLSEDANREAPTHGAYMKEFAIDGVVDLQNQPIVYDPTSSTYLSSKGAIFIDQPGIRIPQNHRTLNVGFIDHPGATGLSCSGYYVPSITTTQLNIGDSDQNGVFESGDVVQAFQDGRFEDEIANNSHFDTGDWNLDGDFDMLDLEFATEYGNFVEMKRLHGTPSVPEPSSILLMGIGSLILLCRRR